MTPSIYFSLPKNEGRTIEDDYPTSVIAIMPSPLYQEGARGCVLTVAS